MLEEDDLYYAFSIDTPPVRVKALRETIDARKTEENATCVTRYDRIVAEYLHGA